MEDVTETVVDEETGESKEVTKKKPKVEPEDEDEDEDEDEEEHPRREAPPLRRVWRARRRSCGSVCG